MSITAKVIKDSISPEGKRLTTFVLRYPRFIHADTMTHRVFSRNASSSRAQPVKKLINETIHDMAAPIHWGANQSGMQAREELSGWKLSLAKALWRAQALVNAFFATVLTKIGLHKQLANRPLEAFTHITVIVTATEWENFYALRNHPDAMPELQALAQAMLKAYNESVPARLHSDEWHLPFVSKMEQDNIGLEAAKKSSVARCARVSYNNHDGSAAEPWKDAKLYKTLYDSGHFSPFEHQATPGDPNAWSGNFKGWVQHRKTLPNESRTYPSLNQ